MSSYKRPAAVAVSLHAGAIVAPICDSVVDIVQDSCQLGFQLFQLRELIVINKLI